MVKKLVHGILRKFGYEVRRTHVVDPDEQRGFNSSYLSQIAQPKTVIDVGVGYGTEALYHAYPTAKFILVEPLTDYEDAINRITSNLDCKVYYKALSNAEGTMEMIVDTENLELSSFQTRTALAESGNNLCKRQVEVTTLDSIIRDNRDIQAPILLKVDTEGHELEVLEGGKDVLRIVDTVIAEVSVARRFEGSYTFEEFILFMKDHGFRVFDFLTVIHVGEELTPRYVDVVFKRESSLTSV